MAMDPRRLAVLLRELDKLIENAPPDFAKAIAGEKAWIIAQAIGNPEGPWRRCMAPHPVPEGAERLGQAPPEPAGVLKRLWRRLKPSPPVGPLC